MVKGFVFHEGYLAHDTGAHPERKERLIAIYDHLKSTSLLSQISLISPKEATEDEIALIHDRSYINAIKNICLSGGGALDLDTVVSKESYKAALLAAGGVLSAIEKVRNKKCTSVFCAVRPPGHHALRNKAMGFCIFNNIAIGARWAQKLQMKKVFIIDWDAHHGNGTQDAFYTDPTVFYFSIHQWPLYPGTGRENEIGLAEGRGYTLNCPVPAGSKDEDYVRIFEEKLVPAVLDFDPDIILISAGYDAHELDPLTNLMLTTKGYGILASKVAELSKKCNAPVVAVLEGGYNLRALAESVAITIEHLP